MGKFPFKRPRIISKKFPEMDNHIDQVRKSLESLVFTYSRHVDRSLQKKHLMMAVSSLALLVVLGSLFTSKSKADSSTFHPTTCLGGWVNPHSAEGEPDTSSNGDATQFTEKNSAILPKNTNADIYCGSFTGKFDEATKPKKIVVTLAITQGEDVSEALLATVATSTDITASTTDAGAMNDATSSSLLLASTTELSPASSTEPVSTTTEAAPENVATSSTPTPVTEEAATVIDGVIESVKDTINDIINLTKSEPETDTVVIPPPPADTTEEATPTQDTAPAQDAAPATAEPTSFLDRAVHSLVANVVTRVFAQEEGASDTQTAQPTSSEETVVTTTEVVPIDTPSETPSGAAAETTTEDVAPQSNSSEEQSAAIAVTASTTTEAATSSLDTSTTTDATTTLVMTTDQALVATTTDSESEDTQNNFLEVFYTFDGQTWESLGELNEISMKYRTFEIPVTSSTSWNDMSELQIKIESKKHQTTNPTVYLDAMTVDVFFETVIAHEHPDFSHDTIVTDKTNEGVRVVNLINGDNNMRQVWYTTVDTQSGLGISAGSWVEAKLHDIATSYRVVDIFGQNIFWVDENQKMLWITNLKKESNDGTAYVEAGTTTATFMKGNGEEWYVDYVTSTSTPDVIYYRKAEAEGGADAVSE